MKAIAFIFLLSACVPLQCLAGAISGEMNAWELFWWTGGTDYPRRWWHGLGPAASMGATIAGFIVVSWYLLSRLRRRG